MMALAGVLVVVLGAWPGAGWGAAQGTPSYDLMVLVYAPDEGPARAALSYPTVVDHKAIERGLEELGRRSGARIGEVRISEGRLGRGMPEAGTSVEFAAEGLVREGQGALPVGPIVRSLVEWRRMRLVFVVGESFRFAGPQSTEADGYRVQLVSSMKPYEYDVERRSSRLSAPEGVAKPPPAPAGLIPAALIGLPAGVAMGWLVLGEWPRGRTRASRR